MYILNKEILEYTQEILQKEKVRKYCPLPFNCRYCPYSIENNNYNEFCSDLSKDKLLNICYKVINIRNMYK